MRCGRWSGSRDVTRRIALLGALLLGPAPQLWAQGLYYEGSLSVASGRYIFAERTTSWSLATGLAVGSGRVTVRASFPVYLQNSTLVSLSSPAGGMPTGGSSSGAVSDSGAARKQRGGDQRMWQGTPAFAMGPVEVPSTAVTDYQAAIGDPTVDLGWRAIDGTRTGMTVTAMAKAPVADTASFGTGQWDVGSSVALSRQVGRRASVGVNVSYWHLGDLPTLDFRDPVYGSAGVTYLARSGWAAGASISGGTSALEG